MKIALEAPAITLGLIFPASRLPDAEKRVAKYARKAAKLGQQAPTLRVVCEFDRTLFLSRSGQVSDIVEGFAPVSETAIYTVEPLVQVEITGERPIVAGWEFAATVEHTGEGNFIWSVPGAEVPREYRDASATLCDHCHTRRDRNKTYVVRNVETGDHKRVGSSCLQDHLGDADPATWLACYQFIRDMESFGEQDSDGLGSFPEIVTPTLVFMAAVVHEVRSFGFVSSKASYDERPATGSRVLGLLTGTKTWQAARDALTPDDYAKARECLAWLAVQDDESGFIYNAQLASRMGTVAHKTCRLLAAVVPSFDRELVGSQQAAKINEHLAVEVGARPVLDLLIEHVTGYYTDWGYTTIVRFLDGAGRTVIWKTSASVRDVDGHCVETGASFRVLGTVKALNDYKGTAQTELSRCKLYAAGSEAKPLATAMRKICKARGVDAPLWAWTAAQKKRAARAAA